jgi:hypothetical protein
MTRRGKCRCGAVLHFRKTAQGYKTRCPDCSAVVRLRADATEAGSGKPRTSPSAVLASGPPPLPAERTDRSAESLPLDSQEAPDLSVLSDHESTAPLALAEMEAYQPPESASGGRWWLLALAAGVVIVTVGAAAMWWG